MDREVSGQEMEEMMSSGVLEVFGAQAEGEAAWLQIQSRQEELLELEKRIQGIQELLLDVAVLTEEPQTTSRKTYKTQKSWFRAPWCSWTERGPFKETVPSRSCFVDVLPIRSDEGQWLHPAALQYSWLSDVVFKAAPMNTNGTMN